MIIMNGTGSGDGVAVGNEWAVGQKEPAGIVLDGVLFCKVFYGPSWEILGHGKDLVPSRAGKSLCIVREGGRCGEHVRIRSASRDRAMKESDPMGKMARQRVCVTGVQYSPTR